MRDRVVLVNSKRIHKCFQTLFSSFYLSFFVKIAHKLKQLARARTHIKCGGMFHAARELEVRAHHSSTVNGKDLCLVLRNISR